MHQLMLWGGFLLFIVAMLLLDLGLFQRKAHSISVKESLMLTAFWISLALLFNVFIYFTRGSHAALEFLAGYLIEESLSMDNIFVFYLIFTYFAVPAIVQRTVLFWGIVGAIILRAVFIIAGLTLIHKFHWIIYVFGGLLVWTAIKMATEKDKQIEPNNNPIVKLFRRLVPVTETYEGNKFFVKKNTKLFATPLFIVLLVVETTDLIFAVDSIPAIFAVTLNPFIVYTSNIFAILGLRALYFTLASLVLKFEYLNYGLSVILAFVGIKMLISEFYRIPISVALGVIAAVLTTSILFSILKSRAKKPAG